MISSYRPPRQGAFTFTELMIVIVIIGLIAAVAIPAYQMVKEASERRAKAAPVEGTPPEQALVSYTYVPKTSVYNLATVRHDGHLFVVRDSNASGMLHHPDCPCLSKTVSSPL